MQAPAVIALSVFSACAAGVAASLLLRPEVPVAPSSAGLEAQVGELQQQVASLQQALAESRRAAPAAAVPASATRTEVPTVSDEQIAAAVEAYMKRFGATPAGGADAAKGFDLESEFDKLATIDFWQNPELWRRAFEAGKMDEVIAKYEELVKGDPKDPKLHMNLAKACIAYLQMDPSKWQLSLKADKAYDSVLDLDENHWEARFSKAVSYTFWPDFMGKKKAALEHFEILVQQQELQPVADHHAQTYLFLGNLLEQSDPERAREVWRRGAQRHPNDPALRDKNK